MEKKQNDAAATGIPGGQRRDIMGKEIFREQGALRPVPQGLCGPAVPERRAGGGH